MKRERIIEEICRRYDRQILNPMFGKGEIRARLNKSLRILLREGSFTLDKYFLVNAQKSVDLDSEIDFRELEGVVGSRIPASLASANIKTYRDLIKYQQSTGFNGGGGLLALRGFGRKSLDELDAYLSKKGIRLPLY